MKRLFKWLFFFFITGAILLAGAALVYKGYIYLPSNPHNYQKVENIPVPDGYARITGTDTGFSRYLRNLPLKPKGSKLKLYTGGDANLQMLAYAVVDLPLLSNAEQCADVCMRLRAEYLYQAVKTSKIHFMDVNGKTMRFGGGDRKAFQKYLRNVYGMASTFSLSRELKQRALKEIQPGDVFVYPARVGPYGHAVMVVDVAENPETGDRMFLLAEGNTPARSIHVMRNWNSPTNSPWFHVNPDDDAFFLGPFHYQKEELKQW